MTSMCLNAEREEIVYPLQSQPRTICIDELVPTVVGPLVEAESGETWLKFPFG